MKRSLLVLVVIAGLLATCAAVFAYPSIPGPSGGAVLPDSSTVDSGQLDVALDFFNQKFAGASQAFYTRLVYGLSPNSEIGATYSRQEIPGPPNFDQWGLNAKYVAPFAPMGIELAGGVIYNTYLKLDTKVTQIYAVGTKQLWAAFETVPALNGKVGVNWTSFNTAGARTEKLRVFAGLEYLFAKDFVLAGEIQFKEGGLDSQALTSAYVRYMFDDVLSGQIGITNAFRQFTGASEHDLFLGFSYRFLSFSEN